MSAHLEGERSAGDVACSVAQADRQQQVGVGGEGGGGELDELAAALAAVRSRARLHAVVAPRVELHDARGAHEVGEPDISRVTTGRAHAAGRTRVAGLARAVDRARAGQRFGMTRRQAQQDRPGIGQQLGGVRRGAVRLDHDVAAGAQVGGRVGLRDRAQVGELHLDAGGKGQRSDDHGQVEAHRIEPLEPFATRAVGAAAEQHGRPLAHDVPGRRELLAQAVVGWVGDGGV